MTGPESHGATEPLIREAREEDLPRLLVLLQQLSERGQMPEEAVAELSERHRTVLHELERDPRFTLLVLEEDKEVQGSCTLYVLPNLSHGASPFALVENVIVEESLRGRRYGERLMAEALRRARAAGCYKVALLSNIRRPEAHRFYERLGFENTHKGYTLYDVHGPTPLRRAVWQ